MCEGYSPSANVCEIRIEVPIKCHIFILKANVSTVYPYLTRISVTFVESFGLFPLFFERLDVSIEFMWGLPLILICVSDEFEVTSVLASVVDVMADGVPDYINVWPSSWPFFVIEQRPARGLKRRRGT
ncbi:hypothetical protein NEUTE2DRAFT_74510 [Neurospora tetrasperma FGSC 2509]|nr:hypothetical protein NEUTE2DRAFT_74510 [Neurospora tetrasperma FGSC 2509]